MSANAVRETDGKRIGNTTIGTTGGAVGGYGAGKALAAILIHFYPELAEIAWAIEFLLEACLVAAGGILVGKHSPTNMAKVIKEFVSAEPTSQVTPPTNLEVEAETVNVEEKPDSPEPEAPSEDDIEFIER